MEKIKWCLKVKNGIELVEPNENLSRVYTKKAEDALRATAMLKNNRDWEISSCYYSMYFALYAILIRVGIKCENHSCTIEFMKGFLREYFTKEDFKLLKDSLKARVDAQYYADRKISDNQYKKMIDNAPNFMIRCKENMFRIKETEIADIRKRLSQINKHAASLFDQDEIAKQRMKDIKANPSIGKSEKELDAYLKKRGVQLNGK